MKTDQELEAEILEEVKRLRQMKSIDYSFQNEENHTTLKSKIFPKGFLLQQKMMVINEEFFYEDVSGLEDIIGNQELHTSAYKNFVFEGEEGYTPPPYRNPE
jgi:hypothetical protein